MITFHHQPSPLGLLVAKNQITDDAFLNVFMEYRFPAAPPTEEQTNKQIFLSIRCVFIQG